MGSRRLPKKVLTHIAGKPMLEWVIKRVSEAPEIQDIILATTRDEYDDELVDWATNIVGLECFRGSTMDVLDRYYHCADFYKAELIVRVTADDPLKDPKIISKGIKYFDVVKNLDYCSNTIIPSYPEGLDIEVFTFAALEHAWKMSKLLSEREHVTPFIWKNPKRFNIKNFSYHRNLSDWRWTVDKQEDVKFMQLILEKYKDKPLVDFEEIISYLEKNPWIRKINEGTVRNEGYLLSLREEHK